MRIENELKLDYDDVLIRPKRSTLTSRSDVSLEREYKFQYNIAQNDQFGGHFFKGVPLVAANMDGVGTMEMACALAFHGISTCLKKDYSVNELVDFFDYTSEYSKYQRDYDIGGSGFTAMSIGTSHDDLMKFRNVLELSESRHSLNYICVDVANGYSERFVETIETLRNTYPNLVIIAGNVVTPEMTEQLILAGANIVKIGIGPGSCCTTRIQTGVGYPQLSAVIECADAAHGLGGHVMADGGCKNPGDVAKAFAAGSDFVMLGGMFSGHDEGGGEVNNGVVEFYGMSSKTANEKHNGGLKDYRSSEGRTVRVPYKGCIHNTVKDILGGLRSTCTYVGASSIKELSKRTTFIRCNNTHNRVYENYTVGN